MPTLHLRNVPESVNDALTQSAKDRGISKNQRAIEVLERGLGLDHAARLELIERIRRNQDAMDDLSHIDIAAMIREGRPGGDD